MYLEKFKSGKNTYIRLVECYRDPNTKTNRKKVIKNYGNYEKLKDYQEKMSPDDPDQEILAVKWYTKEEIYNGKDKWRTRLVGKNFDAYFKGQRCPLSIINSIHP